MTTDPEPQQEPSPPEPSGGTRIARHGVRYAWAAVLVVAAILFVVLVVQNTRTVKVGWVFGYSRISLVFLVLFAAVLGWLLGIATSVLVRRRARRPLLRRSHPQPPKRDDP